MCHGASEAPRLRMVGPFELRMRIVGAGRPRVRRSLCRRFSGLPPGTPLGPASDFRGISRTGMSEASGPSRRSHSLNAPAAAPSRGGLARTRWNSDAPKGGDERPENRGMRTLSEPRGWASGGSAGIRTRDLSIKSRLLYQLSYGPTDRASLLGTAAWVNPPRGEAWPVRGAPFPRRGRPASRVRSPARA